MHVLVGLGGLEGSRSNFSRHGVKAIDHRWELVIGQQTGLV
jgi:hypothetical protein